MRLFSTLIVLALSAQVAAAAPKKSNTVTINATTLRQMYLSRNIDLQISLNSVQQAKTQVSMSRAALLPSLSMGGMISSGPSFMLNTVSFLFPFLIPQNWMNLRENIYLLEASTISHYIAQLNGYASAYSLYATISSDMRLRDALQEQYENFKALEESLKLPSEMGIIRKEDYMQAQAQTSLARVQVSQADELIKKEKATLRMLLGLSLNTNIRVEAESVPASSVEGSRPQSVLNRLDGRTPEIGQLIWLVNAAKVERWSKTFNFLNSVTLAGTRSGGGGSFSSAVQGQVAWGPGYFPALQLSNLQINLLQLQMQDVNYDMAAAIETTLATVEQAKVQREFAGFAEDNLREVYESEKKRYEAGQIDMQIVVNAGNALTSAIVSRIEAQNSLNNARISLHRMTITGQFSKITYCRVKKIKKGVYQNSYGRVFQVTNSQYRLEDLCR